MFSSLSLTADFYVRKTFATLYCIFTGQPADPPGPCYGSVRSSAARASASRLLPRGPSLPRVPSRSSLGPARSWFFLTGFSSSWSFLTELSELQARVFSLFAFPSFLGWPCSFLCISNCLGSRGPVPVWRVELCLHPECI